MSNFLWPLRSWDSPGKNIGLPCPSPVDLIKSLIKNFKMGPFVHSKGNLCKNICEKPLKQRKEIGTYWTPLVFQACHTLALTESSLNPAREVRLSSFTTWAGWCFMRLSRSPRVTQMNGDSNPLLAGTTLASTLHGRLGKLMLVSLALESFTSLLHGRGLCQPLLDAYWTDPGFLHSQ